MDHQQRAAFDGAFVHGIETRVVHAEAADLRMQFGSAQAETGERLVGQVRQRLIVVRVEGAKADAVRRERGLDVGHPVVQRTTHVGAVGVRHEHEAAHAGVEQRFDQLLDRLVVARMPEVGTEVGPNGLEQPLGHQVGMDVDDRIRRLDRGAHPYTGVSQWRYRGSSPRTALK